MLMLLKKATYNDIAYCEHRNVKIFIMQAKAQKAIQKELIH